MKPFKPAFLKTYGKQSRKLCAWISPENRKQAFDSSGSKNESVFESPKQKKTRKRKTGGRRQRAAKDKAMQCLVERSSDGGDTTDKENIIPSPPSHPLLGRQARRRSKSLVNVQQKKNVSGKRKTRIFSVPGDLSLEGPHVSSLSHKEAPLPKQSKNSSNFKAGFIGQPRSVGRFVTYRRRALAGPSPPKGRDSLLNSSDDFTSGASLARRTRYPSRRLRKPPAFESSSEENSLNTAGISGFAFNPLQKISLYQLPGCGLSRCPQSPLFCSTPCASFFIKSAACEPFHNNLSASVSAISIKGLCSSQENLASSPHSVIEQQKESDPHNREELSSAPSAIGLSTHSAGTSQFVSATGGLEWLIETLKEKCLTKRCAVQLERLDLNTHSELCSKSAYSSCFEHSRSVHVQSTHEKRQRRSQNVDLPLLESENLQVPLENESHMKESTSVTGSHSTIISPLIDKRHSAKHSSTQVSVGLPEAVYDSRLTTTHDNSHFEVIMDTPSPSRKVASTSPEKARDLKKLSLVRKCSARIHKLALEKWSQNQDTSHQKKECTHPTRHNPLLGEMTVSGSVPVKKCMSPSGVTQSTASPSALRRQCLTKESTVNITRVTKSQLKEILQFKDAPERVPAVFPSACDDQEMKEALSENGSHNGVQECLPTKVNVKSQHSGSFQHVAAEKETPLCDVAPSRKKMSLAPKDRKESTVLKRPRTVRKAGVSGLSVSRWKTKGGANKSLFERKTAATASSADCRINDSISTRQQHVQDEQNLLGHVANFYTPLKANPVNISTWMADLTPSTPTWSRLKAALSVHRKVLLTPKCLAVGSHDSLELADVSQDLFAMPLRSPFSRLLHSQLRSCLFLDASEEDLSDAEKVYAECGQEQPLAWETCIHPPKMKKCVKIGEGTFGEVFTITSSSGEPVALKVIPVEGAEKVNGEDQKTFGEILHEIIISKELCSLKEKQHNQTQGFIGLKDLHCVKGCYPPDFLRAWDAFDKRKGSENDRPDFFEEDQLFLILEFEFGGVDLENSDKKLASLVVAKSILHQVTAALAVAEQELHFEHRDLHWGNVLVKTTKEKTCSFLLNGTAQDVETKGILVRIIDYSLSRLEIDNLTVSCDISNDEELFLGQGDYQFDIYRLMRQENGNIWSNYHPRTNVLWLHYLSSKLLTMKYRSSRGRDAKDVQKELTRFYDNVLQYSSATEVLHNHPMFQ